MISLTLTLESFSFSFFFSAVKQHLPWAVVVPIFILSDSSSWIRLEPVWLRGRLPASTKLNLIKWEQHAKMGTSLPITYPDTSPSAGPYCRGNLGEADRASCLQVQYNGTAGAEGLAEKLSKLKAYYSMLEEKWVTKYYTQSKTWTCQRQQQHTLGLVHNGAFRILWISMSWTLMEMYMQISPEAHPSLPNLTGKVTAHCICQRKWCLLWQEEGKKLDRNLSAAYVAFVVFLCLLWCWI